MSRLIDFLDRENPRGLLLVFEADADNLNSKIRKERFFIDLRTTEPDKRELLEMLTLSFQKHRIVHIGARETISDRLLDSLASLELDKNSRLVIISSPATGISSFAHDSKSRIAMIRDWSPLIFLRGDHYSPWAPNFRQAVFFVHGIGEQRPMQSITEFAEAVLGREQSPNYTSS